MKPARFEEKLKAEKARLERSLASVGQRNPQVPGDWEAVPSEKGIESDVVDQADTVASYEGNSAILNDLEARYDHVLAALARIEVGTYGKCSVCGKSIEVARLEADPAATTCKKHLK